MTPEQIQALLSQCTPPEQNQPQNPQPPPSLPAPQPINPAFFPALNPLQMAGIYQQLLLQKQLPALNLFNLAAFLQPPLLLQTHTVQNPTQSSTSNPSPNSQEDTANDSGFDSPASNLSSASFGALTPFMQSILQTPLTQSAGSAFSSMRCSSVQSSSSSSIFSDDLQQSVKTALNTAVQAPESTPILARKGRKDYCKVCQTNIFKNGARSQGPRRHVLQHHLQRAYFLCTLCEFGSNYDKAHVHSHARRMHPHVDCKAVAIELPRWVFEKEEKLWMETCFGEDSDGIVSQELSAMMQIDKSEAIKKAKAEVIKGEAGGERETTSPFSMSSLLTPAQPPAPDTDQDIKPDVQNLIQDLFSRNNV